MKKKKQRNYIKTTTTDIEYMKVIKIAIGVILVLGIVYLVTALATGEIKLKKEEVIKEETKIQYEEIIAGEVFNRTADDYYVLLFNFTDTFASYYLSKIDSYNAKDNSLPFYIVDLEKSQNGDYVTEDEDYDIGKPNQISDLKVVNPTLLKISNGKTSEVVVGRENILNFFNEQ